MAEIKLDHFAGIYTSVNPFSRAPLGAFEILDNAVIKQPSLVEPRRGYQLLQALPGSGRGSSLVNFLKGGLAHTIAHQSDLGKFSVTKTLGNPTLNQAMTCTPGTNFQGNIQPYNSGRVHFARAGQNTYATTSFGLFKSEDGLNVFPLVLPQLTSRYNAYSSPGAAAQGSFGSYGIAQAGTGAWLLNGYWCGYVFVACRKGANKDVILGPPSDVALCTNGVGSTCIVALTVINPPMLSPDAFIRVYRTRSVPTSQNLPVDYYLVTELAPIATAGQLGYLVAENGTFNASAQFYDLVPDAALYLPLYTNPTDGNGIQAATATPPCAVDVATFKGVSYLANTKDVERYVLQITGVDATNGLANGASITIDGLKYRFQSVGTPSITDGLNGLTFLWTAGTASQNMIFTAKDLCGTINLRNQAAFQAGTLPPQQLIRAQYIDGSNGGPGSILLQRLVPGADPFSVSVSSPNGWGNNFVTNSTSTNNAQVAGLAYSPYGQPDCFPTANLQIVGDSGSAILKLAATKDSLWIFKTDGLYRLTVTGSQIDVTQFDPTVILIAPDSVVVMNNEVYCLCREGVLRINEQGKTNVSLPIQRELLTLVQQVT